MIEVNYSKALKNAAEEYLINCFKDKKLGTEAHPNLIASSMGILQGVGWFQDSSDGNARIEAFLDSLQIVDEEGEPLVEKEEEIKEKSKKKKKGSKK